MGDRRHFDRVAAVYDRGRPPYPSRIYELLEEHGALGRGARILEIGAGSGQATAALLARGAEVDAVEPGANLAELLRQRFADRPVRVLESDVEDVPLASGAYDTALAATSLHWVDLDRALPRIHAALRPGGWLVPWWTVFGDPDARTPFRERVDEIAVDLGGPAPAVPGPLCIESWTASLEAGGLFAVEGAEVVRWSIVLSTSQIHDLFTTFPGWAGSPHLVDRVAEVVDDCGGKVEEHYVTAVYLARRVT